MSSDANAIGVTGPQMRLLNRLADHYGNCYSSWIKIRRQQIVSARILQRRGLVSLEQGSWAGAYTRLSDEGITVLKSHGILEANE